MTASLRRAAFATSIGLIIAGLPAAARADTSSSGVPTGTPSAGVPTGITTCGSSTTGTASAPTQTPGTTGADSTPTGSGSATPQATAGDVGVNPLVPCIQAGGNVYIVYVITVTTTTTPISAPILAANGPLTWQTGIPVSTGAPVAVAPSAGSPVTLNVPITVPPSTASSVTPGAPAVGSVSASSTRRIGGWTKCTVISRSSATKRWTLSCPVVPTRPGAGRTKSGARIKLLCKSAPAGTALRKPSKQPQRPVARIARARRKPSARLAVLCARA